MNADPALHALTPASTDGELADAIAQNPRIGFRAHAEAECQYYGIIAYKRDPEPEAEAIWRKYSHSYVKMKKLLRWMGEPENDAQRAEIMKVKVFLLRQAIIVRIALVEFIASHAI